MHKQAVIDEMRVKPQIDVESEVETRVNFIKSQLLASGFLHLRPNGANSSESIEFTVNI